MPDDWYRRRGRARRMLLRPVRFLINPQSPKVVVAVVVVLAVLAGTAWRFQSQIPYLHRLFHPGPAAAAEQPPEPVSTHPDDPFWGTPAASFPSGQDGLALPPLQAAGVFPVDDVMTGLGLVTGVVSEGHLDQQVTVRHDDDVLLQLFPPDSRAALRKELVGSSGVGLYVHIAPGARLAKVQPRVKGDMTYRATTTKTAEGRTIPVLEITTNYVWVYPFAGRTVHPGDHLVVSHEKVTWWVYRPGDVADGSVGLWWHYGDGYWYNVDCASGAHNLLQPPRPGPPSGGPNGDAADDDPPAAYYDPDKPLDGTGNC